MPLPSPPKMKSAASEDRGRLPRALPIYSGTPAGHTSTGTGGASCLATYNLAYPPFCPYPSVLVALKPISGVVAASPPACLLTCLHSNLFRPTKGHQLLPSNYGYWPYKSLTINVESVMSLLKNDETRPATWVGYLYSLGCREG